VVLQKQSTIRNSVLLAGGSFFTNRKTYMFLALTLSWQDVTAHVLMDTIVGIIVAFLFLRFVLFYLRPRIDTSPEIAIETDETGVDWYWFKIVNRSRYEGFDLKFTVESSTLVPASNGCYHRKFDQRIGLHLNSFSSIPRYLSDKKEERLKSSAPHCFQVRTKEDVRKIMRDKSKTIILHVSLKHGLSGLARTFDQPFTSESVVKKGSFAFGNKLKIV
jgi:hypothetical protein